MAAIQNKYGKTFLHIAARYGHADVVEAVKDKISPEVAALQDKYGRTFLHYAAEFGSANVVEAVKDDKITSDVAAIKTESGDKISPPQTWQPLRLRHAYIGLPSEDMSKFSRSCSRS
eukprot:TRINITY_DN633_c0_g1_i3.p1 TRINITY_DN633_c0_g1~~TRINITY_DN633_c0_g1_i3.p1  ORF type:complete len:117 (+),score=15.61 TRINITY_DN633_c0_g1_i3:3-353(+)